MPIINLYWFKNNKLILIIIFVFSQNLMRLTQICIISEPKKGLFWTIELKFV